MLRKLGLLIIVGVFGLGLVAFAGCGDDEESGGSAPEATETAPAETPEETTEPAETTEAESNPTSTGDEEVDAAIKQAVESCKTSVNGVPNLQPDTIADLEEICEDAASGDIEDVQKATEEVCTKIVEDSIPEGSPASVKEQALAACDTASG